MKYTVDIRNGMVTIDGPGMIDSIYLNHDDARELADQIIGVLPPLKKYSDHDSFGPQSDAQILFDATHGTSFGMK